jgi:hypothetical protein
MNRALRSAFLLLDRQFEFPDGVWATRVHEIPTVNVAGPTPPRPVVITQLHFVSAYAGLLFRQGKASISAELAGLFERLGYSA